MTMDREERITADELQTRIMDEVRKFPECADVRSVAITRPANMNWDVAIVRDGPGLSPQSHLRVQEIAMRLRAQYDLADE
jgi:hypothetical protein